MITQRQLLNEGFWDRFKGGVKSLGSGAWTAAKEFGKFAMPETSATLDRMVNSGKTSKDRIGAALNPQKKLVDYLADMGMYPMHGKDNVKMTKNAKGEDMFIVKVSRLQIGDNGERRAEISDTHGNGSYYKDPRIIIVMDKNHDFKIVKPPRVTTAARKPGH
jgi:hypothetical protein